MPGTSLSRADCVGPGASGTVSPGKLPSLQEKNWSRADSGLYRFGSSASAAPQLHQSQAALAQAV